MTDNYSAEELEAIARRKREKFVKKYKNGNIKNRIRDIGIKL